MFKKAEKAKSKLRLALTGPSGAGKTYSALTLAKGLGGRVAVLDTENSSASLYADKFQFDVVELSPPYSPDRFIAVIEAAEKAGYETLIIDSVTHEWQGRGGILEIHENIVKSQKTANSYTAWKKPKELHQAFIDAILHSKINIIATMRSKSEYIQSNEGGRSKIEKVGMASVQSSGIEYEFTTVFDLSTNGNLTVASKDRTALFPPNGTPFIITEQTAFVIKDWLESGVDAVVEQWKPSDRVIAAAPKWIKQVRETGGDYKKAIEAIANRFEERDALWLKEQLEDAEYQDSLNADDVPSFGSDDSIVKE